MLIHTPTRLALATLAQIVGVAMRRMLAIPASVIETAIPLDQFFAILALLADAPAIA